MAQQSTTDTLDPLGERCRRARIAANLTQDEAGYRLRSLLPKGRSPGGSVISRIESGKIVSPEPYVLAAMAEVYGVPLALISTEAIDEVRMLAAVLNRCDLRVPKGIRSRCNSPTVPRMRPAAAGDELAVSA